MTHGSNVVIRKIGKPNYDENGERKEGREGGMKQGKCLEEEVGILGE